MICFGRAPKSSSTALFTFNFSHGAPYCCVKYSNIEYQDDLQKLPLKSISQKVMTKSNFGNRFHDLLYFEVGNFPYSLMSI